MIFVKNKFKFSKQEIFLLCILLFIFFSFNAFGNDFGLGIADGFNNFIQLLVKIFRPITAAAIIVTLFMGFTGRPVWTMGLWVIGVCATIANLDKILNWVGLTGGVVF